MYGVFDDHESQPVERRRDTELTLGPVMLLGLFFVLVLLCGLCFGLGYSMGKRGSQAPTGAVQQPVVDTPSPGPASLPKPSASPQSASRPDRAVVSLTPVADTAPSQTAGTQSAAASPAASVHTAQPEVRPALASQSRPLQPAQTQPAPALPPSTHNPAAAAAQPSHPEDADVLVGALRKRGYAVNARRDPADNLIHVRMGPFKTRDEANRWKQKLLNDGYNALVRQ
jgi:cell division septation protein DedD